MIQRQMPVNRVVFSQKKGRPRSTSQLQTRGTYASKKSGKKEEEFLLRTGKKKEEGAVDHAQKVAIAERLFTVPISAFAPRGGDGGKHQSGEVEREDRLNNEVNERHKSGKKFEE